MDENDISVVISGMFLTITHKQKARNNEWMFGIIFVTNTPH